MLDVIKFGGTSLKDASTIDIAARYIGNKFNSNNRQVVVVVSAQAGETEKLMSLFSAQKGNGETDLRARDMVLSSGEQIASGLMSQALFKIGINALPMNGYAAKICTDRFFSSASIKSVDISSIRSALSEGLVPVITGFQGVSETGELTTLGRGGSDTTAMYLASALNAHSCEIITDVAGLYTADPNIYEKSKLIPAISYSEMLEVSSLGAKILHKESANQAMKYSIPVVIKDLHGNGSINGTTIDNQSSFQKPVNCIVSGPKLTKLMTDNTQHLKRIDELEISYKQSETYNCVYIRDEDMHLFKNQDIPEPTKTMISTVGCIAKAQPDHQEFEISSILLNNSISFECMEKRASGISFIIDAFETKSVINLISYLLESNNALQNHASANLNVGVLTTARWSAI